MSSMSTLLPEEEDAKLEGNAQRRRNGAAVHKKIAPRSGSAWLLPNKVNKAPTAFGTHNCNPRRFMAAGDIGGLTALPRKMIAQSATEPKS